MNKLIEHQSFQPYKPLTYNELCDMMDQLTTISFYNKEEENNSLFKIWLTDNKDTNEFFILSTEHNHWLRGLHKPLMQNHRFMCMELVSVLQPDLYKQYLLRPNHNKNRTDSYP